MEEGLELPYVRIIEGGREGRREGGKGEGGGEGGGEGAAMAAEHFVELLQYMTLRWAVGEG